VAPRGPDLLDQLLRLQGAETLGRSYVFVRLARINIAGHLDYSETSRVLSAIRSRSDWFPTWMAAAERHEALGAAARAVGADVSAGDGYLRAALCAHWATMFGDEPTKSRAHERSLALYAEGAPLFEPPAWRAEIPFEGDVIPAWVRNPPGASRGVVLMIGGADTNKEELHHWGTELLRRGLDVVAFDGPGQGELAARYGRLPMRFDAFHRAVSTVIDWVGEQWGEDASPLGVFGNSLGGYLALDAGRRDPRIGAVISNGGFCDARLRGSWPAPVIRAFGSCLGLADDDEVLAHVAEHLDLARVPAGHTPATLVVHGGREDLSGEDEAAAAAKLMDGTLLVLDDGWHTCTNRDHVVSPLFADWMAAALSGRAPAGARTVRGADESVYGRVLDEAAR
jgi:2,6-dihydroxypseudooxynicotine hydrolase